jgi:hypothetical protein
MPEKASDYDGMLNLFLFGHTHGVPLSELAGLTSPFSAARLILRTPGLRTLDKQYIFPGPPQRQCCGILCSVAALYSALPIPALPRYYYYGDPPRPAKAAAVQLLQLFWLIFELSRFRGLTKGELRPQHRRNWGHFSNRKRSCNPS